METLLRAAAVCIPAAVLAAAIKKDNPAAALLLTAAAACVTLYAALGAAGEVADFLRELADTAGVSSAALSAVLKTVGIAIISRLASDICRDAGMSGAASATELAGTAAALYAALPLMRTALSMVSELI